ncbi:MAG: Fe-Mn family superoxide dismutase [Erythrobacter sp.]|nr:Fe-Mn family superoxide dismutase [Erythrobacter sp.]MDZ4273075.1 Fe-Mn family superoxide dismutase [Erythrobacter sp.]
MPTSPLYATDKDTPILGNEVWGHAYFLEHRSRRSNHLEGWWQVVNWGKV